MCEKEEDQQVKKERDRDIERRDRDRKKKRQRERERESARIQDSVVAYDFCIFQVLFHSHTQQRRVRQREFEVQKYKDGLGDICSSSCAVSLHLATCS